MREKVTSARTGGKGGGYKECMNETLSTRERGLGESITVLNCFDVLIETQPLYLLHIGHGRNFAVDQVLLWMCFNKVD